MKFIKAADIKRIGRDNKELPTVPGYRADLFTIHKDEQMGNWKLSVNGIALINCWYIDNAKLAAKEFAAVPINWAAPMNEIQKEFGMHRKELIAIKTKYSAIRRVFLETK